MLICLYMLNIKKTNNLKGENMKHRETIIANKIVQGAKKLHSESIRVINLTFLWALLNAHQFRAITNCY